MSTNLEISSSPVVSATARLALGLHGNFVPAVPQPADDLLTSNAHDAVGLDITVYTPRSSSVSPLHDDPSSVSTASRDDEPFDRYRYPSVDFPLHLRPVLRHIIRVAILRDVQSVIAGDDHEAFGLLAEHVTALLNDLTVGRPESIRGRYTVSASLFLAEAAPGGGPREASEYAPAQTVTYRSRQQEEISRAEEDEVPMITETSCPICLQDFVDGEGVQLTPCGHPFHVRCLRRWLHRKAECPLCRSSMPRSFGC